MSRDGTMEILGKSRACWGGDAEQYKECDENWSGADNERLSSMTSRVGSD